VDRPFIERLRIVNYGCIRDLELALTPLHAFIGPNDSGKTTVLEAVRTITTLAVAGAGEWWRDHAEGKRLLKRFDRSQERRELTAVTDTNLTWAVARDGKSMMERLDKEQAPIDLLNGSRLLAARANEALALSGSQLLHLDPDALRAASSLIPQDHKVQLVDSRGTGLPAVYDALLSRNLDAFVAIRDRLTALFPAVGGLELLNPTTREKALGIRLVDGTSVPAEFMSEGMLYFLAFAALPYLRATAVILIEEPENGLHPARIIEVMSVLREVSNTTQILIATHSPLVVNELDAAEVTVLTRDPQAGTQAVLLKDTPNYAERAKVYSNGELWVSYADGEKEAPLLQGGPTA
jgi:predicted ATPase